MKPVSADPIKKIIDARVFLSPMAGITDLPFRLMARKCGCKFAFTEMIDCNGIFHGNKKTMRMIESTPEDAPLGVQIVGSDVKKAIHAAKVCEEKGFILLDFNAACPARKVVRDGKGSALLLDTKKLAAMVGGLVKELEIPVTVKIRGGWDGDSRNYIEAAKIVESEGAKAISIHPRTRDDMYKGKPDHGVTKAIKEAVKIPVFASGNIFSAEDVKTVLEYTGCDAVAVARGALGRPWIFREINDLLSDNVQAPDPSFEELLTMIKEHFALSAGYSTVTGRIFPRMYKHLAWYLKGYKGINEVMKAYLKIKSFAELEAFLEQLNVEGKFVRLRPLIRELTGRATAD